MRYPYCSNYLIEKDVEKTDNENYHCKKCNLKLLIVNCGKVKE